ARELSIHAPASGAPRHLRPAPRHLLPRTRALRPSHPHPHRGTCAPHRAPAPPHPRPAPCAPTTAQPAPQPRIFGPIHADVPNWLRFRRRGDPGVPKVLSADFASSSALRAPAPCDRQPGTPGPETTRNRDHFGTSGSRAGGVARVVESRAGGV